MERSEIIEKLKPIIATYVPEPAKDKINDLSESSDFITDLYINSANLVDVILDVEEVFEITIDNDSMEKMLTVGASIDVILEKINQK